MRKIQRQAIAALLIPATPIIWLGLLLAGKRTDLIKDVRKLARITLGVEE